MSHHDVLDQDVSSEESVGAGGVLANSFRHSRQTRGASLQEFAGLITEYWWITVVYALLSPVLQADLILVNDEERELAWRR